MEKLFSKLKEAMRVLLCPKCWMQLNPYSPEWDAHLNQLMADDRFKKVDGHTAMIGGLEVWISNHPYGSFTLHNPCLSIRPKRSTILRAHRRMVFDHLRGEAK